MKEKPQVENSHSQRQLDEAEKKFEAFNEQVKSLTQDQMNAAKKEDVEPQTKLSQKEIEESKDLYLKPTKTFMCRAKFNERFREDYNFAKEYVHFIAENREILGEAVEFWTKPFAGVPYEFWKVPVNKPIWAPRYVAERVKGCSYHRLKMEESIHHSADGMGKYYGSMVIDTTVQRLDALPVSSRKSIFMGASGPK